MISSDAGLLATLQTAHLLCALSGLFHSVGVIAPAENGFEFEVLAGGSAKVWIGQYPNGNFGFLIHGPDRRMSAGCPTQIVPLLQTSGIFPPEQPELKVL